MMTPQELVEARDTRPLVCGHSPTFPHSDVTTGTATLPDGREVCFECADDWQRARMLDVSPVPFVAYLSSDGKTITTWSGGRLADVIGTKTARVGFRDMTGKRPVRYYLTVRDVHGQTWRAVGPGPGMYIRMRKVVTS